MPTISDGFDGFSDLILPVVLMFSPPMISGYSRPSSEWTLARAERMARAFSGFEKSVNGSLRNGPSGRKRFCLPTRTASSVAAIQVTSTGWDEYLIRRQPSGFFSPGGRVIARVFRVASGDRLHLALSLRLRGTSQGAATSSPLRR